MNLDWSEQSPHIRTLYHPWQPGDGYEEDVILAAEARIGARLPASLRTFYHAWGRRWDLTQINQHVVGPVGLVRRPDALIFCVENQGCCWWAIERHVLEEPDPPVVIADPGNWDIKDIHASLTWMPSHAHLSDFLDDLAYFHAFSGGAIHGGYTRYFRHQEYQNAWLEQHWRRTDVGSLCFGRVDVDGEDFHFYVRDGQALKWFRGCSAAVRKVEDLDEIAQELQFTWTHRW